MTAHRRTRRVRSLRSIVLLSVAMALFTISSSAQSARFVRTDYPFLGNNIVAADFDNDGDLDLAGCGNQSAAVMLGNGNGSFQPAVRYPVGGQAQDLASGDFNRDGRLDLVVTINTPEIGLSLLTGNVDGTFDPPVNFPNTARLDSPAVVAVDLNNDGKLDIVIGHEIACYTAPCIVGRTISVMLGNGDGTFQPAYEIEVGTGMTRIAVGDFNRDGVADLGISGDRAQVYILIGVGNGRFLQQTLTLISEQTIGVDGTDIDVGDVNGDTIQDLVAALALNGSRTAILVGNGDGTFDPPLIVTEPGTRIPQYQVVADYNGDSFQDLALSLGWGLQGLLEILNGNGNGTFQPPALYNVPSPTSSIGGATLVTGDFNGDGKPDIAQQYAGASAALMVLINSTGSASVPPAYGIFTVSPSSVTGGSAATGTVTLVAGAVAPAGGLRFTVSSSSTSVATVPSSVLMPAGSSRVTFPVSTSSVTSNRTVTIRVSNNQLGSRSATLTVTAAPVGPLPAPSLLSPAHDARFSAGQAIAFDWSDVSGAASYTIQIDDSDAFSTPLVRSQAVTASQYTESTLPRRRMWWRIRAHDAAGNPGAWSTVRRVRVE
jgi:hypothetical protein